MKIFFDEDTGGGIPAAIRACRLSAVRVQWPRNDRNAPVKKGTLDEVWIPWIGQRGYLLFSCNKSILRVEAQRRLLVQHRVGAVFLSAGQHKKLEVLRLVVNQWEWLVDIWKNDPRPFAFIITITGIKTPQPLP